MISTSRRSISFMNVSRARERVYQIDPPVISGFMKAPILSTMINSFFLLATAGTRVIASPLWSNIVRIERPLWRHVVAWAKFIFAFNAFPLCQIEPDSPNDRRDRSYVFPAMKNITGAKTIRRNRVSHSPCKWDTERFRNLIKSNLIIKTFNHVL